MHLQQIRYILFLLAFVSVSGCKNTVPEFELYPIEPTLVLDFHVVQNGEEIALDQRFIDQEGFNMNLIALRFFIANIQLTKADGSVSTISEVEFVDFEPIDSIRNNVRWGKSPKFYVEAGNYKKLSFGVGLPPNLNTADPTLYENAHPLSTYTFMHWTWATMYRFIILEAKADTTGGENLNYNVLFHTGLDSLYRSNLNFEFDLKLNDFERDTLHIDIDWNQLFYLGDDAIDLKKESVTHTTDTPEDFGLAQRFTNNFIDAISLRK
jgi:hypothetical protein